MDRLTIRNSDGSISIKDATKIAESFDRLAKYEDTGLTPEEIKRYAEDVAIQFSYHVMHDGRAHIITDGLSTLERTFDILGWDDPHPCPELECQWKGCHEYATCGTPTKNGYMRVCSKHLYVIQARGEAERALKGEQDA